MISIRFILPLESRTMIGKDEVRGTGKNSGNRINDVERGLSHPKQMSSMKQSSTPSTPRSSVDKLFVYDSHPSRPLGCNYFQQAFYPHASVVGVANWDEFTQALARYSSIQTLIICVHGSQGGLEIAGRIPTQRQTYDYFRNTGARVTETIHFECCNVMRDPVFASHIVADIVDPGTRVIGYTLYHMSGHITVEFPIGISVAECQAILDRYIWPGQGTYWFPDTPTASWLASNPGTHTLHLHWFGSRGSNLPPPRTQGRFRSRDHIFRETLVDRNISNYREAAEIRNIHIRGPEPIPLRIIITDVAAVSAGGP